MQRVFGLDKDVPKCLSVCEVYKKTDKTEFSTDTKRNIEDGQRIIRWNCLLVSKPDFP
jgi:hypothetical protein